MGFYKSLRGRKQAVKSTSPLFGLLFQVFQFQEANDAMLAKEAVQAVL